MVHVDGHGTQNGTLGELPGLEDNSGTLVLLPIVFMVWKIIVLHLCVVKSGHLALQMTC